MAVPANPEEPANDGKEKQMEDESIVKLRQSADENMLEITGHTVVMKFPSKHTAHTLL